MNLIANYRQPFLRDMSFIPDKETILFFDNSNNQKVIDTLDKHASLISSFFNKYNLRLLTPDRIIENIANYEEQIFNKIAYNYPHIRRQKNPSPLSVSEIQKSFLKYSFDRINEPCLFAFDRKTREAVVFNVFRLLNHEEPILLETLKKIAEYLSIIQGFDNEDQTDFRFHHVSDKFENIDKENLADYRFPSEAYKIKEEISVKINELKALGIEESIIKEFLFPEVKPIISRMVITANYQIILPSYNNKKIELSPLSKSVFFLFLKHPEGILFKHLPQYKNELWAIYKTISNRDSLPEMSQSIEDLVNPTKNSINEKCSRIREAFISEFDESLARNYFITGSRASPKKIILDRKKIIWEADV